jgi:hypothetical protein
MTFTQKGCTGVEMRDFSSLIALTNEILSIRVEKSGDGRSAPIQVTEGYSIASAEAGIMVDGAEMTIERREQYFKNGAKYMLSEEIGTFVQRAFLHEMQQLDLTDYDFQSNIPKSKLRDDLAQVADEHDYLADFVDAWVENQLYYIVNQEKVNLEPSLWPQAKWYQAKFVWESFALWAKDSQINITNCRSVGQLLLNLTNKNHAGELNEQPEDRLIWRKVGAGNKRMCCCRRSATTHHDAGESIRLNN